MVFIIDFKLKKYFKNTFKLTVSPMGGNLAKNVSFSSRFKKKFLLKTV
jgi:hypothetical protein